MAKIPTDANLTSPMGDMRIAVAIGAIPGYRTFRKFGSNFDVDSGTEDVWSTGGVRVLPSTYGVATVVSTGAAAAQDSATGTGISKIQIEGLDANWDEQTEVVQLTGATPVNTTSTWSRIHRMFGVEAGSGVADAEATGTVAAAVISASVDSKVQCSIALGNGQSLLAGYSVPRNHTLIIDAIHWSTGRAGAGDLSLSLQYKKVGEDVWRKQVAADVYQSASSIDGLAMSFPGHTDLRVQVVSSANNIEVAAEFDGLLISNPTQGNFG